MTVAGTGRPVRGYRTLENTRVPSVTTITGRFKDAGGLMHWAWQQGIDGIDYKASRDAAASAGSCCHGFIEKWIHGQQLTVDEIMQTSVWDYPDEVLAAAMQGYAAFKEWAEQVDLQIIETERALVSEQHLFGGTFDATAIIAGKLKVLLDWKTSNKVYPEYVAQLAAYRQLLRERDGDEAPEGAQLLRVGKDFADFHLHAYPPAVLDLGWSWFQRAREMYELDRDLKKVAA